MDTLDSLTESIKEKQDKVIYDKICLMIPTYNRIRNCMIVTDSALKHADDPFRLKFSYCVNVKDAETRGYLNNRYFPDDDSWEIIDEKTKQPNLSLYFNKMYDETRFNEPGTLVSELGDDMVFLTKGWDTLVLNAMNEANGKAIVYCDDNYIAHEKCCVNLFTSRKMVEATKKPFMCPLFHADMIDVIWTMAGLMTNTLKYLPNVIIQHNHSTKLEEEDRDDTFKRLAPVQQAANSADNHKLARAYAHVMAKNLIEAGIGKWNTLR